MYYCTYDLVNALLGEVEMRQFLEIRWQPLVLLLPCARRRTRNQIYSQFHHLGKKIVVWNNLSRCSCSFFKRILQFYSFQMFFFRLKLCYLDVHMLVVVGTSVQIWEWFPFRKWLLLMSVAPDLAMFVRRSLERQNGGLIEVAIVKIGSRFVVISTCIKWSCTSLMSWDC